jgi:hypothetical protein
LSIALLWGQHQLQVLHPYALPLLILLVITFGAALRGLWRVLFGPRRLAALTWALVGLLPTLLWGALGWYGFSEWGRREVPHDLPFALMKMAGASLMEAQARAFYPHRLESQRLVMFYDGGVTDPQGDIDAMDRHVAAMEELTGLPLRTKVYYVRGKLLDQGGLCYLGLALASPESPAGYLDRHELAHAVLYQHNAPDTDPPTLLSEGWAESQSNDGKALARQAVSRRQLIAGWRRLSEPQRRDVSLSMWDREGFERLVGEVAEAQGDVSYLRVLTGPLWYHHDKGAVYPIGGAFVDFLLRRYGAERFVDLYFACRPGSFEAECRRVYGTALESLEAEFWADAERRAGGQAPP